MKQTYSDDIAHIREMMEKSSRFISLSGLSGIGAGITGLITGGIAYYMIKSETRTNELYYSDEVTLQLILLGMSSLLVALFFGCYFTIRKSKQLGLSIWTSTTKKILS